jgi:hypothetical protein
VGHDVAARPLGGECDGAVKTAHGVATKPTSKGSGDAKGF